MTYEQLEAYQRYILEQTNKDVSFDDIRFWLGRDWRREISSKKLTITNLNVPESFHKFLKNFKDQSRRHTGHVIKDKGPAVPRLSHLKEALDSKRHNTTKDKEYAINQIAANVYDLKHLLTYPDEQILKILTYLYEEKFKIAVQECFHKKTKNALKTFICNRTKQVASDLQIDVLEKRKIPVANWPNLFYTICGVHGNACPTNAGRIAAAEAYWNKNGVWLNFDNFEIDQPHELKPDKYKGGRSYCKQRILTRDKEEILTMGLPFPELWPFPGCKNKSLFTKVLEAIKKLEDGEL